MAPRVIHAKVSGKAAGSDPNRVYGTHWDADHTILGLTIGTDVQAHDATLDGLAALTSIGLVTETATDTFTNVTIAGTTSRVAITNGSGAAGNPTIDIDAAYVGQSSITTLGTITTGTWHATKVGLAFGGTNADLSATGGPSQVLKQVSLGAAITVGQLAVTDLAVQAAYTINGNTTGSSASPVAFTIGSLTNKATPAGTDLILIQDQAASGALKYSTVSSVSTAAGVSSLGGLTGALGLGTGLTTSGSNIVLNASTVTNTLGGDVALNNTATYFDGPSCAQGTSGTWLAIGQITTTSSASGDTISVKLWDGTTVMASAIMNPIVSGFATVHLSGIITSPAANIKLSVKNATSTTQFIRFNASSNSKDSTLTVTRIA